MTVDQRILLNERVFLNRSLYQEAERLYSLRKDSLDLSPSDASSSSIQVGELIERLHTVEAENAKLRSFIDALEARLAKLEVSGGSSSVTTTAAAAAKPTAAAAKKDDDDFDLFGDDDDEDSEEKKKITEERLKLYNAKKSNKAAVIAKSSVMLDVKVWDDETDMKALEEKVRSIQIDGLIWGSSKLIPVAFGVKKLQITCVIEDDKVSTEALEEKICEFEDYVQSVDIAAFNKI